MSSKAVNENKGKAKQGFVEKVKKYFREMKSELKKVVWPSRKQVLNNTGVVIVMVAICGLFIGGFDVILTNVINLLFKGA